MFRNPGNVVAGALLLLVAVGLFVVTLTFPPPGQDFDPGTATFPRILIIALAVLAVPILFDRRENESLPHGRSALRVIGVVVLLVVYALLLDVLGFLLATILFLVATVLMSGTRNPVALVALPLGVSFALFYVFSQFLSVALPRGIIEGILF